MVYLWLLGMLLGILGLVLQFTGLSFFLTGRLLRRAGGNIDPERGLRADRLGQILMFVGIALVFLAVALSH